MVAAEEFLGDAMAKIEPPRIGTGKGYFIAGWIAWALFLFCAMAAAGGGSGAEAVASLCAAVGIGCFAVGFWTKLFGALERRLIDVQRQLAPGAAVEAEKPSVDYSQQY